MATAPETLFDKVWRQHLVADQSATHPAVLYIDLHLIHEVTSPQAFSVLRERGLRVRRPERTFATMDHSTPTDSKLLAQVFQIDTPQTRQLKALRDNCIEFGVRLFDVNHRRRGIVHVIGPELGLTQPGKTIVCGDSHTSTHGAFGALAFGIGTTEVGHVLATQCLLQRKPKSLAIEVNGALGSGVTAKDLVLAIIERIGVNGGTGHVIEFRGKTVAGLSMEQRMTVCNMSIEAGARAGMIAPDDTTFEYLKKREFAPRGEDWDAALAHWRQLPSDYRAEYDRKVTLDASRLAPQVTFGTNPGMVIPIDGSVPSNPDRETRKALSYMGLNPGQRLLGQRVDVAFIGSCTNSRLSDLREAARVLDGRRVAKHTRALVVPGSQEVKRQAEALGLDKIFRAAGAEWHEAGCSMCLAMNGDRVGRGKLAISTSNRNFEGRQGAGARTILASPLTAAAAAVAGEVVDPRILLDCSADLALETS